MGNVPSQPFDPSHSPNWKRADQTAGGMGMGRQTSVPQTTAWETGSGGSSTDIAVYSQGPSNGEHGHSKNMTGIAVGVSLGVVALLGVVGTIVFLVMRHRRKEQSTQQSRTAVETSTRRSSTEKEKAKDGSLDELGYLPTLDFGRSVVDPSNGARMNSAV